MEIGTDYHLRKICGNIYDLVGNDTNECVPDVIVKKYKRSVYFDRECANLKILKEVENIPKIVSCREDYIIMSKLVGDSLIDVLIDGRIFSEEEIKNVIYQLICIVLKIHEKNIVHRDIKPDNILLGEKDEVLLIDFDQRLTERYIAPEILKNYRLFSKMGDAWSVGVVCYQMLCRQFPWKSDLDVLKKKFAPIRVFASPVLKDFIRCLLEKDPDKRLSLQDALKHDWFKNNN